MEYHFQIIAEPRIIARVFFELTIPLKLIYPNCGGTSYMAAHPMTRYEQ